MKKNFKEMNKNEKKELMNKYYQTENGKINKGRFLRLLICGILCIIYSITVVIEELIKQQSYWNYVLAAVMFIFGFIFLLGRQKVLRRNINYYLAKNK